MARVWAPLLVGSVDSGSGLGAGGWQLPTAAATSQKPSSPLAMGGERAVVSGGGQEE